MPLHSLSTDGVIPKGKTSHPQTIYSFNPLEGQTALPVHEVLELLHSALHSEILSMHPTTAPGLRLRLAASTDVKEHLQ